MGRGAGSTKRIHVSIFWVPVWRVTVVAWQSSNQIQISLSRRNIIRVASFRNLILYEICMIRIYEPTLGLARLDSLTEDEDKQGGRAQRRR